MSRILIVYGTTDGQAGKIAMTIGARLRTTGLGTDVFNAAHATPEPRDYDAVVVAASVHAGGYQRAVSRWVRSHAAALNGMPTAFVSVCLGVLQHEPAVDRELAAILDRFTAATGWRPSDTKIVAGALKYTQYHFIKRWLMKRIAGRAGGDTDTSRDYEYTDWNDLGAFVDRFAARAGIIAVA